LSFAESGLNVEVDKPRTEGPPAFTGGACASKEDHAMRVLVAHASRYGAAEIAARP